MSPAQSAIPANTADATQDLQERLGRFARLSFLIAGAILVTSLVADIAAGPGGRGIALWSRATHVAVLLALLVLWRLCRGRARPAETLEAWDAGLCIGMGVGWAAVGLGYPASEPIEPTILLATTYTLFLRSVIVPSTSLRSLVVSVCCVLPVLYFLFSRGMPFMPSAKPATLHAFLGVSSVWCLVAALTAALNSRQLYGLRKRLREINRLGQYTLEEKIGEGGMGVVHRATHAMLRRPAAIKLLLPGRASERDLMRFEREVLLTSRLSHPNTISIFDYGRTADGVFYYVMEYLDGFDLQRLVELEGPLSPARALHILEQAAAALGEAHARGLVHRDIKPANLILTERPDAPDVLKVVDFGLVKTLESGPGAAALTQFDTVIGTPMCLAPEAITTPDGIDGRADLYALGAVGYYLVTGRQVFEARTVVEMCSKHLHEIPLSPSERLGRALPAELDALLLQCLAKAPADRPASALELLEQVRACARACPFDPTAAREWWQTEAPRLRASASARATKGDADPRATTMAVDLRGRGAATGPAAS